MANFCAARFAAIAVLTIGLAAPAWATPALEFDPTDPGQFTADDSAGWSFTTNQALYVVALDAYDPTGDGDVRLYNALGDVLASATLTTSDATEGSPTPFYSAAITPVALAADTTYFIVQDITANETNFYTNVTGLTTNPAITYDGGVDTAFTGQDPTTDNFGVEFYPSYFGPNFDIGTPAPEPASLSLLLAGLGGLVMFGRRRVVSASSTRSPSCAD